MQRTRATDKCTAVARTHAHARTHARKYNAKLCNVVLARDGCPLRAALAGAHHLRVASRVRVVRPVVCATDRVSRVRARAPSPCLSRHRHRAAHANSSRYTGATRARPCAFFRRLIFLSVAYKSAYFQKVVPKITAGLRGFFFFLLTLF